MSPYLVTTIQPPTLLLFISAPLYSSLALAICILLRGLDAI